MMKVKLFGVLALALILASCSCAHFKSLKPMKPNHKGWFGWGWGNRNQVRCSEEIVSRCPGRFQWRRLDCGKWTKDCQDLINPELKCPGRWKWSNVDGFGWTRVCFKTFDQRVENFCPGRFTWARLDNWGWVKDCLGVWNNEQECPGRYKYINAGMRSGWTKECLRFAPQWYFGFCPTRIRWDRLDDGRWLRQCSELKSTRPACNGRWRWVWLLIGGWRQNCVSRPAGWKALNYGWRWDWQLSFGAAIPDEIPQASKIDNFIFGLLSFLKKGERLILQVSANGAISVRLNPDTSAGVPHILIVPNGNANQALKNTIDQLEDELNDSTDLESYSIKTDYSLTASWGRFNNLEWFAQLQALYKQKKAAGIYISKSGDIEVREDKTGAPGTYLIYYDRSSDDQSLIFEAIQDHLKRNRLDGTSRLEVAVSPKASWYLELLRLLKAGKQVEIDIDANGNIVVREAAAKKGGNPWFFSKGLLELEVEDDSVRALLYKKLQDFLLEEEDLQQYTTTTVVTTIEKPISSQTLGEQKWLDSLEQKVKTATDVFIIIDSDAKITLREDPNDNKDGVGTITLVFTTADRSEEQIAAYQRIQRLLNTRPHLKKSVFESSKVFEKKDTITVSTTTTSTIPKKK